MLIRNIWAVGRNDRGHVRELGNEIPKSPVIFLKAGSSAVGSEKKIQLPQDLGEIQYELELALCFDEQLQISSACLALDLTARSLQEKLKEKGLPWTAAKSFKNSCPVGPFFRVVNLHELDSYSFVLKRKEEVLQQGSIKEMLFQPVFLVEHIRKYYPVCPGDLLLTGTTKGVGPLFQEDSLLAEGEDGYRVNGFFS